MLQMFLKYSFSKTITSADTEKTQWDHPKMADIMSRLCEFNEVKYSAYRTAMKLRAVQKRLFRELESNLYVSYCLFQYYLRGCFTMLIFNI